MKYEDQLGCFVDNDLNLSQKDINRCLRYRREMPLRVQWFKERRCVSCGHLPTKEEFHDEKSLKYFSTVRICQHCQDRMF